jgi:hypothetical protein
MTPEEHAWQKALIPITRPIDTLVICLERPGSEASKVLGRMAELHGDFVDVIDP